MVGASEPCPARDVLEGFAAGQPVAQDVSAHLRVCAACRQALRRIREDNEFLRGFAVDGAFPIEAGPERSPQVEIPGYRIVRELHHGGQGVVFQAVQLSTKREVAIKVMKHGPFATLADRARFDREIETLGKLNHPNIVAVHDAGVVAGFQYFVMNYIDGQPLDEAVLGTRGGTEADHPLPRSPLAGEVTGPPRGAHAATLELFAKVCDAVHAAHLRGVMHRDLKPSNIRVDGHGEPHVLDFGLAKPIDADGDWAMTRTGQFVGSLPWASPEQVEGASARIDLRTDVYSLGAMLFQLLTGRLPFDVGSNLREAVDSILFRDPPRPSAVLAATGGAPVNDELDTIVLKCLSKDRERRYQSAGELARDLRRYLAGEAIEAKRDSAAYMLRKTLRRYRLRVAVVAAFVTLLGVFAGVMAVLYRRAAHLEREAVRSGESLTDLLAHSNIDKGRMAGLLGNIALAEQLLWDELLTRRALGGSASRQVNEPPGPPEAYWGLWELYRRFPCLRSVALSPATPRSVTASDDGACLWTVDADGTVQRLDAWGVTVESYDVPAVRGRGLPMIDATGTIVISRDGPRWVLWRRDGNDRPLLELPPAAGALSDMPCVSRGGRRVAAEVDGAAVVWDLDPPAEVARFGNEDAALTAVAISNDNARLAARDQRGGVHLWDIATRQRVARAPASVPHRETPRVRGDLLFSPDDRLLADAWIETPGRVWDLDNATLTAVELSERPEDYRVQSFSPDGKWLAIGDLGGTLRVYNSATGQLRTTIVAHVGRVRSVTFTGDGRGIWTGGDGDLRLWEVDVDAGIRVLRTGDEALHSVEIAPDGKSLIAGGSVGRLQRVDLSTFAVSSLAFDNEATISCVAISPDGHYTAAATYGNAVYIWDQRTPGQPPLVLPHPQRVSYACFAPDETRLATACDDRVARLWRLADASLERELHGADDRIPQVAFDATGRRLAAAVRSGALLLWDVNAGVADLWDPPTQKPLRSVQFSPDDRWLVAAGADRTVAVWDVARRQRVAELRGHNQEIYCLSISRTGTLIASGDTGGTIRLWDVGLFRLLATLDGHKGPVMSLHFSADARRLVSAALDGTLRVWDLTYYGRHIAGNVAVQLRRVGIDELAPAAAVAWRRWAASDTRIAAPRSPAGNP